MAIKKDVKVIQLSLGDIKPYSNNPRKNDSAVPQVKKSIKEFGFKVPIVIDRDHIIVTGHTRYKAAKELKLDTVPCIIADDLTDEQIKAFRLADNKVSEFAEWDLNLLGDELENIIDIDMSEFGFDFNLDDEEQTHAEREDLSDEVKEEFQIIIECKDESQQEELYQKLTEEGLICRVLTL